MVDENREVFDQFMDVHDKYQKNRSVHQDEFNAVGRKVKDVYRDWERRLCKGMTKSYGQYSHKLSEKFKSLIKEDFPLFDLIGVKIKKRA